MRIDDQGNATSWGVKLPNYKKIRHRYDRPADRPKGEHPIKVVRAVWNQAKRRAGWTNEQLRLHLKLGYTRTPHWSKVPAPSVWIALCVVAGIPAPAAYTIYGQLHVPEEGVHYVGCTVRLGKRRGNWKQRKEEYKEFMDWLDRFVSFGQATPVATPKPRGG